MEEIIIQLSARTKKKLDVLNDVGFLLLGSPFLPVLNNSWLSEVAHELIIISLDQVDEENDIIGIAMDEGAKLYLQLPAIKTFNSPSIIKRLQSVYKMMAQCHFKILPLYFLKKDGDDGEYFEVNTAGAIDTFNFLSKKSINTLRMYIEAQFKALHANFNLAELKGQLSTSRQEPIIQAVSIDLLKADLASMPTDNKVFEKHDFQVYICQIENIPNIIKEIGRVRELTFRGVNEGTGRSFDLDNFDLHYHQLFIWDSKEKRIVAGYRLGIGPEIMAKFGLDGMYISKLFKVKKKLIPILARSLEMGRSFVLPDYQKQRLPLYLLWRGILELLTINPSIDYLYGPVSISKSYSNISKDLIIEFIRANYFDNQLAKYLKPRKPYKVRRNKKEYKAIITSLDGKIAELDEFIENIEPTHLRLPVLIRQYIKQNARFIGFNLDPNFSDALDGFVILDLKKLPMATLELFKKQG